MSSFVLGNTYHRNFRFFGHFLKALSLQLYDNRFNYNTKGKWKHSIKYLKLFVVERLDKNLRNMKQKSAFNDFLVKPTNFHLFWIKKTFENDV